ncbi:MAG: hypothetical protein EOL97_16745 [Spirochaetia bacterium]|nr:hypothetical protein [Spirochaetia bacterium]
MRKTVHNKFSEEVEKFIVTEYLSGKNQKEIANQLNTYNTSIRRVLLRNNIPLISSAERWSNRDNVFDNMSEEAQYWIGFLAADGGIHSKSNKIYLGSSEKDHAHLELYSKFVKAPIKRVYNKTYDIYETRVIFRDKIIKDFLVDIGITPNKSKTLKLSIPINRHILRGVFDGDGYARKNKGYIEIATASENFKNQISDFLYSENIHHTIHKNTETLFIIGVYKKTECKKLYELFYNNATIFLERKKRVLSPFYGENQ